MNPLLALPLLVALAGAAEEPAIPAARVTLPWSDFKVLYEKGLAPKEKPEPAPRDFAISRASYTGRVEGESALFDARLRVDVLKEKGWVTVPVLPTTVALRSARMGGKDASIYLDGGWYRLVTDRKGPVDLDLSFAVTTFESGGQDGFSFALPASGGTEVSLSVPSEGNLEFQVANAQRVHREERNGRWLLEALLPATGNLAVTWQRALAAEEQVAPVARVYAEHQALVGVSEGLLQCGSAVLYSILHAGVEHLAVTLPADVTIVDVKGDGIQDWRVEDADGRRRVAVDLAFEAKGSYSLYLDYERPLPEGGGEVLVPDLQVEGVERVKGWVGIDARSSLEVAAGAVVGATPVDVRELPTAILGRTDWPVLLGFKYRKQGVRVPIEVRQHEAVDMLVTLVDSASATTVMTRDGRRMTQVVYAMRNNRAQFLRLDLPAGAELWSAFVGGRAVKPARDADGRLLVPLARSQASAGALAWFAVEVVYVEKGTVPDAGGRGRFEARLPTADVPATVCNWTVWVPEDARVKHLESTLREVDTFTSISTQGWAVDQAEVNAQVQAQAARALAGDTAAAGVEPVRASLPIDGRPILFEKLLVLDEPLEVRFDYRGLERD